MHTELSMMTAQDYLRIVARRWYFVVISVVLAVVGSVTLSIREERTYGAEALVLVGIDVADGEAERLVATEVEVIRGLAVEERASADHPEYGSLPAPSVGVVGDSNVVMIRVSDTDSDRAAGIANAYASAYLEHSRQIVGDLALGVESRVLELSEQLGDCRPGGSGRRCAVHPSRSTRRVAE